MSNNMEDMLMDSDDEDDSEDEVEEIEAPKTSAVPASIPAMTTTTVETASASASASVIPTTIPRAIPTATFTSTTALPVTSPTKHHRHHLQNDHHSAFQPTSISRMKPSNTPLITSASASISPVVQIQRNIHQQQIETKTSGLAQHSHVPSSLSQSTLRYHPSTSTQLYHHVDLATSTPSSPTSSHQQRPQQHHQQQQQQQHPSSTSRQVISQQDQKSQKELFSKFIKTLVNYLKVNDPTMHKKASNFINGCIKKKKDGVAEYQLLHESSMKSDLRSIVGEFVWKETSDAVADQLWYNENENKKKGIIEPIKAKHGPITVAGKATESLTVGTQYHQQQQQHPSSASPQVSSQLSQQHIYTKQFINLLLRYLRRKDPAMCKKAIIVCQDCFKKNKDAQSLRAWVQSHLRSTVGDDLWKKAEDGFVQFLCDLYIKKGLDKIQANNKARQHARMVTGPLRMETQQHSYHNYSSSVNHYNPQTTQLKSNGSPDRVKINTGMPNQLTVSPKSNYNPPTTQRKPNGSPDRVKINTGMPNQLTVSPMSTTKVQNKKPKKSKRNTTISKQKSPTIVGASGINMPTAVLPSKKNTKKNPKQRQVEHASSSCSLAGGNRSSYSSSKKLTSFQAPEVLKEYSERMEMVENMVDYNASLCTLVFNEKKASTVAVKGMVNIGEEQRKLLYGNNKDNSDDKSDTSSLLPHFKGWGDRNILPPRAAWAKLRLIEDEERQSIPTLPGQNKDNLKSPESSWFNEEKAEEDEALALISEATQQYIKRILEAATSSARERMNLDGIRLCHQQLAAAAVKESGTKSLPPQLIADSPLHLRLGCDVRRQCAMAEGNAAKTCQRMEEAMTRKEMFDDSKKYSLDDKETLYNAGSMSELAMVFRIPNAAKNADTNAKRSYEIYGGKHSSEPPLGRVPKKIKISRWDIQTCVDDPRMGMRRQKRSRLYY